MKKRIEYGILAAVLLGVYIWTNQKMSLWAMLFVLAAALVVILLNQLIAGKIFVHYDVIQTYAGGNAYIRVTVRNNGLLPANHIESIIACENVVFGGIERAQIDLSVGGKSTGSYEIPITSKYCGRIDLKVECCLIHDWFDLTYRKVKTGTVGCCYEYPKEHYQELDDVKNSLSEGEEVTYKHVAGYDVSEILQIKEYHQGDNIKNIHWKLSAKAGKTLVKELDCPNDNSVLLLFDYVAKENKEGNHNILTAVSNISQELMKQQIGHTVYRMNTSEEMVVYREVFEYDEFDCLQQELLETEAKESVYKVSDYVIDHGILSRYAKIIYVTAKNVTNDSDLVNMEQCAVVYA